MNVGPVTAARIGRSLVPATVIERSRVTLSCGVSPSVTVTEKSSVCPAAAPLTALAFGV